jgi:hypothetical protein
LGNDESEGLTRRETLKRGLKLTGAVLWVTPVVQVVGMRPAFAQVPSPACNVWYAVKIERVGNTAETVCLDITGGDNPPGQCLDVNDATPAPTSSGGCNHIDDVVAAEEGASDPTWTVTLDEDCQFVEGSDRCTVKTGDGCFEDVCDWDATTRTLTFESPDGDISHVEFAFCCED